MNLQKEMSKKNIRSKDIAEFLGVRYATVSDKLNGKYSIKLDEAFKIKQKYFPELSVEYLFDDYQEEEENSEKQIKH